MYLAREYLILLETALKPHAQVFSPLENTEYGRRNTLRILDSSSHQDQSPLGCQETTT